MYTYCQLVGKFLVPQNPDGRLGWFSAYLTESLEGNICLLLLWAPTTEFVRRPLQEVIKMNLTPFNTKEEAWACLCERKRKR